MSEKGTSYEKQVSYYRSQNQLLTACGNSDINRQPYLAKYICYLAS